jgi:hypothetical protein
MAGVPDPRKRRGRHYSAAELTDHTDEPVSRLLRQPAGARRQALTTTLVTDLHLTEVEVDEF